MKYFIGFLIGSIIGCVLANTFIFPADIFNIKLGNLTIGDVLRIFGGVMVILISTGLGIAIGEGDMTKSPKSSNEDASQDDDILV